MKVLVLGASGIIGQFLRLCVPAGVTPIWARRTADRLHLGVDLCDRAAREAFLAEHRPDVIVNLAGECNVDTVERDPERYRDINAIIPGELAAWCDDNGAHLIHVSSQAVFGGNEAPYGPASTGLSPVNQYGSQKARAEKLVRQCRNWTIVRPTFVLGIRPLPHVGRQNPLEAMLAGQKKQVSDRYFSPLGAEFAARSLWEIALARPVGQILHVGSPDRVSRFAAAYWAGVDAEPVAHESFEGIAPRPTDTTYAPSPYCRQHPIEVNNSPAYIYASDIAMFLGKNRAECLDRLRTGFGPLHVEVTADFNRANPQNDAELLDWYRRTEAYIWELSAYHIDPGFNYSGMCNGIAERLKAAGARRVLCLGDGIGDLTLTLANAGSDAVYHDLAGSRTAEFAALHYWIRTGREMQALMTADWNPAPITAQKFDAIVSLDFLEHVTDVPRWTSAIKQALAPGGFFCAQNAFGIGSEGSMPMHLKCNDRYEREWDPLLSEQGFRQESSNWYRATA